MKGNENYFEIAGGSSYRESTVISFDSIVERSFFFTKVFKRGSSWRLPFSPLNESCENLEV